MKLALFYVSMTSEDYEGFVLEVKDHIMGNCNSRGFLHELIRTCGVFVQRLTMCRFLRIKAQIRKENDFCQTLWLLVLAEQNIYSLYTFQL